MPYKKVCQMHILCFGEIMVEMAHKQGSDYTLQFAGDSFNVAYYMQHLKPADWHISYLTKVGIDDISSEVVRFIADSGVRTDAIQYTQERTVGLFILRTQDDGEKSYCYWRGQAAAKTLFNTPQDLTAYDVISFSGISAAVQENRHGLIDSIACAHAENIPIVYDFNHRKQLWSPQDARAFGDAVAPYCRMLKISDEDQHFLGYGDVQSLSNTVPHALWIYTKGANGAECWQAGKCLAHVPSVTPAKIVDTSAAGDSFKAAFCVYYLSGTPIEYALQKAAKLAAKVLGFKGSIISMDGIRL